MMVCTWLKPRLRTQASTPPCHHTPRHRAATLHHRADIPRHKGATLHHHHRGHTHPLHRGHTHPLHRGHTHPLHRGHTHPRHRGHTHPRHRVDIHLLHRVHTHHHRVVIHHHRVHTQPRRPTGHMLRMATPRMAMDPLLQHHQTLLVSSVANPDNYMGKSFQSQLSRQNSLIASIISLIFLS